MKVLTSITIWLLMTASSQLIAQRFPSELWHNGKIVLLTGDTLKGLIKYDLQQDLVQYTLQDKTVEVYTSRKVMFFEIFDETAQAYRQFFAIPFGNSAGYKSPIFFELLEDGKMTLLARESLRYVTVSSPYYFGSTTRLMLTYRYFFIMENGDVQELPPKKNDLLSMMGKNGKKVEKFMKANRLKVDEKEKTDITQIVDYYNSLESGS